MRLIHFIQREMEHLLEDWEDAAPQVAPELKGADSRSLRDHARLMLEFVMADLATSQTEEEATRKAQGRGTDTSSATGEHGAHRLAQGLSSTQAVQELRALRQRITQTWTHEQQGLTTRDIDELVRFNEAIDQLIVNTISSYSKGKEHQTRLFDAMLKASPDPCAIFDPQGRLLFMNAPMAELTSVPPQDATGKTAFELGLGYAVELQQAIADTVTTGRSQRRELHCLLPSHHHLDFDCQLVPVFDERNQVEAVAKTSRDVTQRRQAERQAWRNANHDPLTGIPNRRLFLDRLEQTLREAERRHSSFALLFIDLDRFKAANDQLGHKAGDRLLALVAERLCSHIRAMDTVARLGGDEFTVLLKEAGAEDAEKTATALLYALEQAFEVDAHRVHISGSIGLTLYPDDGKDAHQLMHNADQAMYAAKERGGHQAQRYQAWMAQKESEHTRLRRELEDAFHQRQLEVYYQPIVDVRSRAIASAEALLRWNHPDRGLLMPATFLATAERSGMADRINDYVLEQAMACSLRWGQRGNGAFPINVNESPSSFLTRTRVDEWQTRLSGKHLDESHITVELTPASLAHLSASGFNPARQFGRAGMKLQLAIDDFGVEPFSLPALHEYRVNSIKVNKALIQGAGQDGDADRILKAIIGMAGAVDIRVVAEGVETDEQWQFIADAGCDYAQGFLFSPPLHQQAFEALLTGATP